MNADPRLTERLRSCFLRECGQSPEARKPKLRGLARLQRLDSFVDGRESGLFAESRARSLPAPSVFTYSGGPTVAGGCQVMDG